LNSAEIYASSGLFRKMWPKLLRAGAAEAIAAEQSSEIASPSIEDVKTFLDIARAAAATTQRLTSYVIQEVRGEPRKSFIETKLSIGSWVPEAITPSERPGGAATTLRHIKEIADPSAGRGTMRAVEQLRKLVGALGQSRTTAYA
jgi:hypothetical protein